jgi:hypothetical protein
MYVLKAFFRFTSFESVNHSLHIIRWRPYMSWFSLISLTFSHITPPIILFQKHEAMKITAKQEMLSSYTDRSLDYKLLSCYNLFVDEVNSLKIIIKVVNNNNS